MKDRKILMWTILLATSATGLLGGLLVMELVLRFKGYGVFIPRQFPGEPVMLMEDAVLGWRSKPGRYEWRCAGIGPQITNTINELGERATSPAVATSKEDTIVILGCSIAHGFCVTDEETFAWKLQASLLRTRIINRGTGGYGTYQSYLMMQDYLKSCKQAPRIFLYAFYYDHENRNVALYPNLLSKAHARKRKHVKIPYCTLGDDDSLQCMAPTAIHLLSGLMERSVLINLLEQRWLKWKTLGREKTSRKVTELIIGKMNELAKQVGGQLLVVGIELPPDGRTHYLKKFREMGVEYVDCVFPEFAREDHHVPIDGHPNIKLHQLWATCMERALKGRTLGVTRSLSSESDTTANY